MPDPQLAPLANILFPIDPAFWACPLQNGLPYYTNFIYLALNIIAGVVFLYGVIRASISYLTAFGDEDKAKSGRETLKWSFIGAIVIMLSTALLSVVLNLFLGDQQNLELKNIPAAEQCKSSTAP